MTKLDESKRSKEPLDECAGLEDYEMGRRAVCVVFFLVFRLDVCGVWFLCLVCVGKGRRLKMRLELASYSLRLRPRESEVSR